MPMKSAQLIPMPLGVGDDAVKKAAGKKWAQWFAILDRAGAKKLNHRQIVGLLHDQHGVGPWWRQMVTVGYEQARGLREKHQKPDGYEISVNKTINVPISAAFAAWQNDKQRQPWLDDPGFAVRKSITNKSMRITWVDGQNSVEAMFYAKGKSKCQVVAQHSKLAKAKAAARMKAYWTENLERLKGVLEA